MEVCSLGIQEFHGKATDLVGTTSPSGGDGGRLMRVACIFIKYRGLLLRCKGN